MRNNTGQAILLMLHRDFNQATRIISYFEGRCDIFIHIDKNGSITHEEENSLRQQPGVKAVSRKYKVHWAGYSILQVEMFLLNQALSMSGAGYFHLISGQDYPIRPLSDFLQFFSHTTYAGYVNCNHLPCDITDGATYYRLQHYVLTDYINARTNEGKQKVWNFVDWQKKHGIRRRIPDYMDHLYGGSAWFSINRDVAMFLVIYTKKHPGFYRRMRFTYIPEEIYVPTVILNSPYRKNIYWKNNCRTILWSHVGLDFSPINIGEKDFRRLLSNPIGFFSRKFSPEISNLVMHLVDEYLLKKSDYKIMSNGGWENRGLSGYVFDNGLSNFLIRFSIDYNIHSVCDMGCGPGWYVANLRGRGIAAIGYDYNPYTREQSALMEGSADINSCGIADLTELINVRKCYDLVLCLSVGQYIPQSKEDILVSNLTRLTGRYLFLEWADGSVVEDGYVNTHDTEYIKKLFCESGELVYNEVATANCRRQCSDSQYSRLLMVFQKIVKV